jgi:internalin A
LSKLESLNLSYNKIQEIPVFLTALHRLVNLDVSHNLITSVPRGLGYCESLAAFNLEGNHVFSPPPMILKMGTPAVIFYLRQLCDADKNEKVDLHGLDLPLLPQEFSELTLVKDVDISNNLLTSIRPLQVMTQLTSLNPES